MYIHQIIFILSGVFAFTTMSFRISVLSVHKPKRLALIYFTILSVVIYNLYFWLLARLHALPTLLEVSNVGVLRSSQIIAVAADYATEIENSVGSEIYGPIFKAGLFIFISGIVSSLVVAFIVSNSNSWEALEDEFQKGKEAQFIEMMGRLLF